VTSTVGVGLALKYSFPNGGPVLVVRVFELFTPSVQTALKNYTERFGTASISEPSDFSNVAA